MLWLFGRNKSLNIFYQTQIKKLCSWKGFITPSNATTRHVYNVEQLGGYYVNIYSMVALYMR